MPYELYPAVDENYQFAPEIRQALAESAELRNTVLPLSQTARNNLTGADLWDGRLVLNTTTDRLNRYDAGSSTWKVIADLTDIPTPFPDPDPRLDALEAAAVSLDSRLDTQEAFSKARVQTTSAGLQLDGASGRWYFATGMSFRVYNPVVSIVREISGTREVDGKVVTGFLLPGTIFVTGGTLSNGLVHEITVID